MMGRQQARWVLGVLVLATLVACQTPAGSPVGPVPPNPTRVEATRWPTRTATATHTPLPTLTPTATRTPTPTPIPGLALEGLRNLSYPLDGVDGGQVKLADGTYGEDDGPVRVAMADAVTFGDLNDDHRDDAVVLLSERAAGSEPQYHLSVVVNQGGEAVPVTSLPLGDRIVPRSMAVATGRLTLEMLVYAEGDAPCCPSLDSRRIYELSDGELVLVTQWDGPRQGPTVPELSVRHPVPFAPGTMASLIRGRLNPLGDQSYVLPGVAEQALELAVTSPNELVSLSLRGLGDGSVLSSVVSETQRWSGSLPSDQLYVISLVSVSGSATSYALAVTTDPPATVPQAGSVVTPTPTLTSTTSVDAGASEVLTDTLASSEGITDVLTPSTTLSGTVTATPEATGTPAGRQSVPPGSKLTLTFDGVAGTEDWVPAVADVLVSEGVVGTFFLVDPVSVDTAGLTSAGSTWGLDRQARDGLDPVGRQALLGSLVEVTEASCVRPGPGAMDALSRVRLAELGYEVVLWDLDVVQSAETDAAVASLLSLARPGSVIRFSVTNDGSQAAAVLTGAIPALIAQGYEFVPACVGSPDR